MTTKAPTEQFLDALMNQMATETTVAAKASAPYYVYGAKDFDTQGGIPPQIRFRLADLNFVRFQQDTLKHSSLTDYLSQGVLEQEVQCTIWGATENEVLTEFFYFAKSFNAIKNDSDNPLNITQPTLIDNIQLNWVNSNGAKSIQGHMVSFEFVVRYNVPYNIAATANIATILTASVFTTGSNETPITNDSTYEGLISSVYTGSLDETVNDIQAALWWRGDTGLSYFGPNQNLRWISKGGTLSPEQWTSNNNNGIYTYTSPTTSSHADLNNQTVVSFNGTTDGMLGGSFDALSNGTGCTVYFIMVPKAQATNNRYNNILCTSVDLSTGSTGMFLGYNQPTSGSNTSYTALFGMDAGSGYQLEAYNTNGLIIGRPTVLQYSYKESDSPECKLKINNLYTTTVNSTRDPFPIGELGLQLGVTLNAFIPTKFCGMDIAEIIFFDKILTNTQETQLYTYFNYRYNFNL